MGWMLALTATAGNVTQQEARQKAVAFLQERFPQTTLVQSAVHKAPRKGMTVSGEQAAYYVFNAENQKGFVIVSGDDRTEEILGFSDTGSFDAGKMPPAMKELLDSYAAQIQALNEMSESEATAAIAKMRKVKTATRNSISPLITTKWDQATPYWNKCPEFMSTDDEGNEVGELAYTGCVATSMAQIMNYYKFPTTTTQEIPSYTFSYPLGNYNYGSVEMEAQPVTTFDWEHMRDNYTGAEEEVYTNAVATLMLYAGCSVKMQYGTSSSGAFTDDIPKGFTDYFGYDVNSIKIVFRQDYDQKSWDDLIYKELLEGRPMIYNGTAGSGGGHSFVCDGYEYGDFFHINWGWGGMGNGFFQLEILNPHASGIGGASSSEGYNMKQNVIIGIKPGDGSQQGGGSETEQKEDALTVTNISFVGTSLDRESISDNFTLYKRKYFKINYADHVGTQKRYDVGVALYDGSEYTMVINRGTYSTALTSAVGSSEGLGSNIADSRYGVKFGEGLSGTYRVVPMYLLEGTSEWKPMLESDRFYLEATVNNYSMTFVTHPINNLSADKFEFEGGEKVGKAEEVNVTLTNNSVDRFFGDLFLWFGGQQLDEFAGYTTTVQAEVLAGETKVVSFHLTPSEAGTKNVYLTYDNYGEKRISGSGSVTIAESEAAEELNLSVEITATNAEATTDTNIHGVIYDSSARFRATITNHAAADYNKYVLAPLFIVQRNDDGTIGGGSMITYKQQSVSIPAGGSVTYDFDFDNLAYGSTYSMNIYARNNVPQEQDASHVDNIVKKGESKYYDIQRGIITWKGDGARKGYKPEEGFAIPADVAAVSLEGLNLSSITANANPNTLYFLGAGETVPAGLEGKNIVKGAQAESVVLLDGNDFYTPFTFNAANISYSRQFTQGHSTNADGWSTLCLPFAATSVKKTTDNKAIDWFHSKSDSGKNFWLMDFSAEDDGKVYFNYADEMLANHPYIVAVPDDHWGSSWDLRKEDIEFSASNVTVKPEASCITSGTNYVFVGTFVKSSLENILALNEKGNQFSSDASQEVDAFRGYYQLINGSNSAAKSLSIFVDGNTPTGITEIDKMRNVENEQLYNLSGQQVRNAGKGIYIKNGKKIIK